MTERRPQDVIAEVCERYFAAHGDSHLGVGWTKAQDLSDRRHDVMLDVVADDGGRPTLLDLGCGLSHLYEHMLRTGRDVVTYSGCDVSEVFLRQSRAKHPEVTYHHVDVLEDPAALPMFDYVVMSGVLTMRDEVEHGAMLEYARALIAAAFGKARRAMAFNVMSKQVDWERDDLFHVPFDELATFLARDVSRHFTFRHDYGLYEYTTYVYREPQLRR